MGHYFMAMLNIWLDELSGTGHPNNALSPANATFAGAGFADGTSALAIWRAENQ